MSRIEITAFALAPPTAGGSARLSCRVAGGGLPPELWCEAGGDTAALSERGNWAAVALLVPAMRVGRDLHVDAAMSPQLVDAINNDLQAFLVLFDPALRRIRVTCSAEEAGGPPGTLVATGFSAGIDSFAALARYRFAPIHPGLAVSTLAVFDVGQFHHDGEPGFVRAVDRCAAFAASHGMRTLSLRSNLDAFYRVAPAGQHGFEKTNTFRNAAAALAFERDVCRYYLASSFAPGEIGVRETYNPAYLDPILLPLLSTERLTLVSACAGLTRVEKTGIVADLTAAHGILEVCTRRWERAATGPINCSHCGKCIRTLFTLEVLGKLDAFAGVFNLERFRRERDRALDRVRADAARGDSLAAEVLSLVDAGAAPARRPRRRWRWF